VREFLPAQQRTNQLPRVRIRYTWVNSAGNTSYQTNDANANPKGAMAETWTKTQVMHGNGTP
jgi:hypothetical protein